MSKSDENTEAGCVEYVFRACVGVASAPLHEASKTIKSGTMLRAEIGRGQLICNDFCQVKFPESHNIL